MVATSAKKQVIFSRLASAHRVERSVLAAARRHGFDEDACFGIQLALEEALANAIHHGNCNDPRRRVTIEYIVTPRRLKVTVTDQGRGFHPEGLPDPTLQENLSRPCGRGVLLMRAYMTRVQFNTRGNRVILIKDRAQKTPRCR